jgi:Right handed beta helix region
VDAAGPGTTILVRRGTYAENVAITTDRISLRGLGARLVPPAEPAPNECSFGEPANDGICAVGQLEFPDPEGPPVVADPVEDVSISGFTIEGFGANGILFFGAEDVAASRNRTIDNTEYGIAAFFVEGVRFVANTTSGSEVAGIYIGDSPNADALVLGNETFDNGLFGFFFRDAADGRVVGGRSNDNCVGAIVLNTGPNVAADWRFVGNRITDNDNLCPGDGGPALSGTGVAIAGASDNRVVGTSSATTRRAETSRSRAAWWSSTSGRAAPTRRPATSSRGTSSSTTSPTSSGTARARATCSAGTCARRACRTASADVGGASRGRRASASRRLGGAFVHARVGLKSRPPR